MTPFTQQVTSLEWSKTLRDLGVPQDGLFAWWVNHSFPEIAKPEKYNPKHWKSISYRVLAKSQENKDWGRSEQLADAFSVAELLDKCSMHHNYGAPHIGKSINGKYLANYIHWYNLWHNREEFDRYQLPVFLDKNPADALAKMLAYLIKNKLITL